MEFSVFANNLHVGRLEAGTAYMRTAVSHGHNIVPDNNLALIVYAPIAHNTDDFAKTEYAEWLNEKSEVNK